MMFQTLKAAAITGWGMRTASLAGFALAICAVPAFMVRAQAQDQERSDRVFSCQSADGERTVCRADLSRGEVQLTKQLGDVPCVEGKTWGRQDDGVWVDRGCRAEFMLPPMRRMERIEPGTELAVRTNETIRTDHVDGRIFTGVVDHDVVGDNGRVAIPRGSSVELTVRQARDQDLILDLESVTVEGQRYAVDAGADRVDSTPSKDSVGANERTGKYVGGGAILGAILGAAAGGGKGAAIGAGVGAGVGAGAEIATSGREVRIPSESIIRFRIDRPLTVRVAEDGDGRDRRDR